MRAASAASFAGSGRVNGITTSTISTTLKAGAERTPKIGGGKNAP